MTAIEVIEVAILRGFPKDIGEAQIAAIRSLDTEQSSTIHFSAAQIERASQSYMASVSISDDIECECQHTEASADMYMEEITGKRI